MKIFEDSELEALIAEDSCQTQEELAESLGVTQKAISKCLEAIRMIQNQGSWVPHELKPKDAKRRFFACEQLLQRWKEVMASDGQCFESQIGNHFLTMKPQILEKNGGSRVLYLIHFFIYDCKVIVMLRIEFFIDVNFL